MPARLYCLIGFLGLNICYLAGQGEDSWERHTQTARRLQAQALYKDAEKEFLAAIQDAEALSLENTRLASTWPRYIRSRAATRTLNRSCIGLPLCGSAFLDRTVRTSPPAGTTSPR